MPNKKPLSPQSAFFKGLLTAIGGLAILLLLMRSHQPMLAGRAVGTPMPPIKAAGWLNGEAPTADEFSNKVLVIDAWASWCGPCRQKAPEMIELHDKYQPQGVEFIGLSSQTEDELEDMQGFLQQTGIKWKNAYGADETLRDLGVEYIPMVWVVDRHNQIVWNQASSISLEEGIRQALAAK
jgi:thiol-disulfide isomerase/thioredoxin